MFLGAFAKFRKKDLASSVRLYVCLSVCPSFRMEKNSTYTGQILMKFDMGVFFENVPRKSQVNQKNKQELRVPCVKTKLRL